MIDLHMHTGHSDGTDTAQEILRKAKQAGLDVVSITDHNTCQAYFELDRLNPAALFDGKIIVGCEYTTSFEDRLIEVLGYGFDHHAVQSYLSAYYQPALVEKRTEILYQRLLQRIRDCNLAFHAERVKANKPENEFFELGIYEELVSHSENKVRLPEDIWDSFAAFFRKGLTNAESRLFIHHAAFKPPLEEIIDLVHRAGGLVFLAHPFQYQFSDTEAFLNRIYDRHPFDGVECYYTTFTDAQTAYMLSFASSRRLLISGGSDYHGANKQRHALGVGAGNLQIDSSIIENWNVRFYQ